MSNWTPTHDSTRHAWTAVVTNLTDRANRGLWSSRTVAETIAQHTGLSRYRAVDLIASAIRHGYLEERPSPLDHDGHTHTPQIRLPDVPMEPCS